MPIASTAAAPLAPASLLASPGAGSTTIELLASTPAAAPTARDLAGFASPAAALRWLTTDVWHGRLLELRTEDDGTTYVVDTCRGDPVARLVEHRVVRSAGQLEGGSLAVCSCGAVIRSSSLAALKLAFSAHGRGIAVVEQPEMQPKMTLAEAQAELAAVGANVRYWSAGRLSTLYVNGANRRKLGEIWVMTGGCPDHQVWAAVAAVVADNARQQQEAA